MSAATKVITGLVRFSYAYVFEPRASEENSTPKYSVSLIIPKSDVKTVNAIKAAVAAATEEGKHSKFGGKIPAGPTFKLPLRDGDVEREGDPAYANSYFLNSSSKNQPQLVDKNLKPIMDRNEFYSGCYGRASLNFYPFNTNGNKGIAAGLNNLQKMKDGDPLGGFSRAEDDFEVMAEMDEDMY